MYYRKYAQWLSNTKMCNTLFTVIPFGSIAAGTFVLTLFQSAPVRGNWGIQNARPRGGGGCWNCDYKTEFSPYWIVDTFIWYE